MVRHPLSLTDSDNILTWDIAVLVAALVTGFKIDFPRLMLSVIHERFFKASITNPFPYMIFELCMDSRDPIWHRDVLCTSTEIVDIGLIRDEANEEAPNRGPRWMCSH